MKTRYSISIKNSQQIDAIAQNLGFTTIEARACLVNLICSIGLEAIRMRAINLNELMSEKLLQLND